MDCPRGMSKYNDLESAGTSHGCIMRWLFMIMVRHMWDDVT